MKNTLLKIICLAVVISAIFSVTATAAPNMNFVIENGEHVNTPICYLCEEAFSYSDENGNNFLDASDVYIDKNDNIYVADTGNNRIVKLDKDGNFVKAFTNNGTLSGPQSVYVMDDGDLFISDTKNQRIVHVDENDKLIETFTKPDSKLLDSITDFSISRIAINEQGLMYLVLAQQFMMIDANNDFKGYVGANKVAFSLKEFFIRTFGSEVQINKMVTAQASTYNSFDIGDNGYIYAVANGTQDQIRVLNVDGENIFPSGSYGERFQEDKSNHYFDPTFIDICVDKNGTIHVLERYSCRIYSYTAKGEMIVAYGGIGNILGKFTKPVALDINSKGEIFVLDSASGLLHKFTPTSYMESILEAYNLFEEGKYDSSMKKWNDVLDINVNCSLANSAMGNILFKQKEFKPAMQYYKDADDKVGYAKAFSKYRHELFREYFGFIVVAVVVLITGIYFFVKRLFKKGKKTVDNYYSGGKVYERD